MESNPFVKVCNKIHCNGFPNAGGDLVWLQGNTCSDFRSLAGGATIHIVVNKLGHSWPPEFTGHEFVGFPSSGVACGNVVVVLFDNVSSEVIVLWHVYVSAM
jgi:hypothetical protein